LLRIQNIAYPKFQKDHRIPVVVRTHVVLSIQTSYTIIKFSVTDSPKTLSIQIEVTSQILAQLPSPGLGDKHSTLSFDDLNITYLRRTK